MFLHYGQIIRSHAQAEALNWVAYFEGTDVTHDPGTVGYGSPLHRGYYTRGLNHNLPLINGEGPVPPQPGEVLAFSAAPARVTAVQAKYRDGASARRSLAIDGDVLTDTASVATTNGPQRLGLALHLQGKARLPDTFAADPAFATGRPAEFGNWKDVRRAAFPAGRATFDVAYGNTALRVTINAPGPFALWHGSAPDTPPHRRGSFYLELDTPATGAEFVTTLQPAR